jgi:hypothetical protein
MPKNGENTLIHTLNVHPQEARPTSNKQETVREIVLLFCNIWK